MTPSNHYLFIDRNKRSPYPEQGRRFEFIDRTAFKMSTVLPDARCLMPDEKHKTVKDFMDNIRFLCMVGKRTSKEFKDSKQGFEKDFFFGLRFAHKKNFLDYPQTVYNMNLLFGWSQDPDRIGNHLRFDNRQSIVRERYTFSAFSSLLPQQVPPVCEKDDQLAAAAAIIDCSKKNPFLSAKYNNTFAKIDPALCNDGSRLEWTAANLLRTKLTAHAMQQNIPTLATSDAYNYNFTIGKYYSEKRGKLWDSPITNPLSCPMALFNGLQVAHYHHSGNEKPMMGYRETEKLVVSLQDFVDNYEFEMRREQSRGGKFGKGKSLVPPPAAIMNIPLDKPGLTG